MNVKMMRRDAPSSRLADQVSKNLVGAFFLRDALGLNSY
jgi:hypothetical protein